MSFCIEVWGEFACFTRPEMKVERVSYDVPTPSAVRGIFEAILWKPAIQWHVDKIEVLNPIRWTTIRRNEVGSVLSTASVLSTQRAGKGNLALYADEDRQQRASLVLVDVRYRLHAHFERLRQARITPRRGASDVDEDLSAAPETDAKYAAMFERRARRGQCFTQPYLGTREFSCSFRLVEPAELRAPVPADLEGRRDLGFMLFDLDYGPPPHAQPQPCWFRAVMNDGVIHVPRLDSEEVRR